MRVPVTAPTRVTCVTGCGVEAGEFSADGARVELGPDSPAVTPEEGDDVDAEPAFGDGPQAEITASKEAKPPTWSMARLARSVITSLSGLPGVGLPR
jgi:hypothetical protein